MNIKRIAFLAEQYDKKSNFKLADFCTTLMIKMAADPFVLQEGQAWNDPKTVLDYFVGFVFDMVSRKPDISKNKINAELDKKINDKFAIMSEEDKQKFANIKDEVMAELQSNSWYTKLSEEQEEHSDNIEITGGPKEFLEKLGPAAQQASENVGGNIPASVILAMAAWESGWGKYQISGNYFGIKAGPTSGGIGKVTKKTFEHDGGKHEEMADFATFENDATSAMSALPNFLAKNQRYRNVFTKGEEYKNNKSMSNLNRVVDEIFNSGYSTDLDEKDAIKNLIRRYNLTSYD